MRNKKSPTMAKWPIFFTISWSVAHFLFLGVFKGRSSFFFSFSHFGSMWSYIEAFKRR